MDIRIRAFGAMVGYLAIIGGSVAALTWLAGFESVGVILMGVAAGIVLYTMYDYILEGMRIEEGLKELEKLRKGSGE